MAISYVLLISRQGKIRLSKFYDTSTPSTTGGVARPMVTGKERQKLLREVSTLVLNRPAKQCNVIEYKDTKVVYKRYASLFFVAGVHPGDNELLTLEIIHQYVEVLDRYFGNVCELDIIFNFHKAYYILDEMLLGGELQETNKREVLRVCAAQDEMMDADDSTVRRR